MVQVSTAGTAVNAKVTYAGSAPGLVSGVTQVNFQMPSMNPIGAGPPYNAMVILYAGGTLNSAGGPVIWFE